MVSASASEPVDREFYSGLCSCSVFAIICNEFDAASLLQVRPMVTSKLASTCCKLVSHLLSCRVKLAVSLQICSASLMQTKIAIWERIGLHISLTKQILRSKRLTGRAHSDKSFTFRFLKRMSIKTSTLTFGFRHGTFHLVNAVESFPASKHAGIYLGTEARLHVLFANSTCSSF
ncbi:hypothetical protein AVEN_261217-1 [Araneus ventricosus]|uniref:Uncharacterized protein n=1 Tax=Araneus ventricosus TaxID=182803 RepID=A0A4Y2B1Y4_ARAVE|nr:hypothetical protein AVEN_261217-1 [Araneus ventricosus]